MNQQAERKRGAERETDRDGARDSQGGRGRLREKEKDEDEKGRTYERQRKQKETGSVAGIDDISIMVG